MIVPYYLQIDMLYPRLTAAEVSELILFKQQRTLWDKRNAYDLIVIFDANSHINKVLEEPSHPINIIRDCTSDCLDPHFMTTDLPKVSAVEGQINLFALNICWVAVQ